MGCANPAVPSTPVVSLSNHGNAGAAVLRRAQDEGGTSGQALPVRRDAMFQRQSAASLFMAGASAIVGVE